MTTRPTPAAPPPRRVLVALGIVVATLLVYLPGIVNGGFHFDDGHHLVRNPALADIGNVLRLRYFVDASLWSGEPPNAMYRPVEMCVHTLDFQVWKLLTGDGLFGPGFVFTNALLHALNALVIWRVALRLRLGDAAAGLAALLFAVHPAFSEVVNYPSARSESVAAAVLLCALLCHLRGREAPRGAAAWYAAAAVLSGLAVASKETTALFCVSVAWLELLLADGGWRRRVGRAVAFGALYAVPLVVVLALRRTFIEFAVPPLRVVTPVENADVQIGGQRTLVQNAWTQARVVVLYYQVLLRPVRLSIDHDVRIVTSVTASVVVALVTHVALAAVAVVAALRGRRLLPLCAGWFWVFLAPSVLVPLNVVMNEHRLYLPGIAVALLGGAGLARVARALRATGRGALVLPAFGVVFAALCAGTAQRSLEWRDDLTLWTHAVERAPRSAWAHMNLGTALHDDAHGRAPVDALPLLDRALEEYATADRLHPRWYLLQLNIGNARMTRVELTKDPADYEHALAAYRAASDVIGHEFSRPRFLAALALTMLERYDEAVAELDACRSIDPDGADLYDMAGARILKKRGDVEGADRALQRLIDAEAERGEVEALLTLGWWWFEAGDLRRSEAYLSRAFEIGKARRLFKPYLYVARFLNVMRQPGAAEFEDGARKLGWSASEEELLWVHGGPTPGVRRTVE